MIAKIRTSNAGWLFLNYEKIEVEYVNRELIMGKSRDANCPVDEPQISRAVDRIETNNSSEAAHSPLFIIVNGYKADGRREVTAFDTEGYILNDNGGTIERL